MVRKNGSGAKDVALSGIISALCFVVMYLSSIADVMDLSAIVLTAMIISVAVIEIGRYFPWLIWAVTSVLCILLLPRKDIALEFVLFGGVYPMVKSLIERKLPTIPSWIAKIVFFNAVFTLWFFISKFVFALDVGLTLGVIAYAAANVFFIIADLAFSMMIVLYMTKIRQRLKIGKKK
ncbi:MAG: hypothetical protein IKN38_10660 [Clostridia bacterium]|nr:hypothetical protein [Clostridia bacterium]